MTDNGNLITDPAGNPVVFDAFIDTGTSSVAISRMQAEGYDFEGFTLVQGLGFTPADYVATYTDTGIGGDVPGQVTRPFGLRIINGQPLTDEWSGNPMQLPAYGPFGLWVPNEVSDTEAMMLEPINLIGMPAIRGHAMVMDPSPMVEMDRMNTYLLPAGDPGIPKTNITLGVYLKSYTPTAPAELSTAPNPMIQNVSVRNGSVNSGPHDWFFDTGSAGTMIGFAQAQALGLIGPEYTSLEEFMLTYDGPTAPIGGVGGTQDAPGYAG